MYQKIYEFFVSKSNMVNEFQYFQNWVGISKKIQQIYLLLFLKNYF